MKLKLPIIILIAVISMFGLSACQSKPAAVNNSDNKGDSGLVAQNQKAIDNAGQTAAVEVRAISGDDHIRGDINAPVQIIVYDDFECSFCARFTDTLARVEEEFKDKAMIAIRHYPLRIHPNAVPAALAAECAAEQGKFWEMYDKLFSANKAGTLGAAEYRQDAADISLDIVKFESCISEEKYLDKIQADVDEAREYGVTGTPGSFVNGEPIPGAVPFEDYKDSEGVTREGMRSIIERHLNKS